MLSEVGVLPRAVSGAWWASIVRGVAALTRAERLKGLDAARGELPWRGELAPSFLPELAALTRTDPPDAPLTFNGLDAERGKEGVRWRGEFAPSLLPGPAPLTRADPPSAMLAFNGRGAA